MVPTTICVPAVYLHWLDLALSCPASAHPYLFAFSTGGSTCFDLTWLCVALPCPVLAGRSPHGSELP